MADRLENIGKPLLEAFPDTSEKYKKSGRSEVAESIQRAILTGSPDAMPDIKFDLKDKNGKWEERYWSLIHYPISQDGVVVGVYQETKDITNERAVSNKLDRTLRQLEQILSTSKVGTWQWHIQQDYMAADDNLVEMFSADTPLAKKGLPLETFIATIHEDDRERVRTAIQDAIDNGSPYEEEYRTVSKKGNTRWVIARGTVDLDDGGEPMLFSGTIIDITDRKRAADVQAFLSNVSKELSSTLNYKKMLVGITNLCVPTIADWCTIDLYDPEKGFEQVSVAHQDPKKVDEAREYRRKNTLDIDEPTGIPNVLRTGKTEYYPNITEQMLEAGIQDPEQLTYMKSLNLHSVVMAPLRINEKVVGGITFVTSDSHRYITETDLEVINDLAHRISLAMTNSKLYADSQQSLKHQKKLEQDLLHEKQKLALRVKERTHQLQLTNEGLRDEIDKRETAERKLYDHSKELTRSNEELENFAYVASHDLQEPLRKIQSFGDLLLSEYGDSLGIEGADYLKRMHSAANRMSNLIGDLLDFSRVARKTHPKRDVDLNIVVSEVLGDLETRIVETNATVKTGKLPVICADPTHMRQLFQNLIGNALKFHKPGQPPLVTVRSRTKSNGVEVTVSDNGVGFDEKYLDRIFSVFQRLHERTKYEGTGIGLAICRKIVEYYGGTITASSKKGEGATFSVWLPIKIRKK